MSERSVWAKLALALLSGGLLALAGVERRFWPLSLFGLAPLLSLVTHATVGTALGWGFVTGFATNLLGQSWAVGLLRRFGGLSWAWALAGLIVIAAYQALVFALGAAVIARLRSSARLPRPFAAAAGFVAAELAIPFLFPWGLALLVVPFWPAIQVAELLGPAAVTFLLVLVNGLVYEGYLALRHRRIPCRGALAVAVAVILTLGWGLVRGRQVERQASHSARLRIGLIQPNFGDVTREMRTRWAGQLMDRLREASLASERQGAQLVVWPETAWPFPVAFGQSADYGPGHPWQLRRGLTVPLLAGVLMSDMEGPVERMERVWNSAWLLDGQGRQLGVYHKNYLLAFGEYLPFGRRFPAWGESVRRHMRESSEFEAGAAPAVLPLGDARLAPLLCYEDILPAYVRRVSDLGPNLLVTMANLSWFGATAAPQQHLALAALRAVEHRLELVRATNTGMTGRVDALGRMREALDVVEPRPGQLGQPEVLVVDAALLDHGPTLYARIGDLFAYVVAAAVVILVLATWRRRGGC